ncbi:SecDF P1 head subdomain-containing protein [Moheibacter lacus]|uniref:SecDF P1 head subdomain domain-containing protein n=1 Tax=Moheibacter lacus TaxID=2745851 RepID=A0A838ZSB1_9FLAO|nr:hypothetical protein [Moheibacter lacus]MBA5629269.1 hypothetical protein [Moheibacter lacus]
METGIYYVKDSRESSTVQLEYKDYNNLISILNIDTVAVCEQKDFKKINVDISGYSKNHVTIYIELTQEGTNKFSEATEKSIGKKLAILSNGKIISAPFVNEKITGGKLNISGNFTISEAEKIKNELTNKSEIK